MTTSEIIRIMLIMRGMKIRDMCKALNCSTQAFSNNGKENLADHFRFPFPLDD